MPRELGVLPCLGMSRVLTFDRTLVMRTTLANHASSDRGELYRKGSFISSPLQLGHSLQNAWDHMTKVRVRSVSVSVSVSVRGLELGLGTYVPLGYDHANTLYLSRVHTLRTPHEWLLCLGAESAMV